MDRSNHPPKMPRKASSSTQMPEEPNYSNKFIFIRRSDVFRRELFGRGKMSVRGMGPRSGTVVHKTGIPRGCSRREPRKGPRSRNGEGKERHPLSLQGGRNA